MVIACVAYNALWAYQQTEDWICHTFFSQVRSFNNIKKTVAFMANNAPVPSI